MSRDGLPRAYLRMSPDLDQHPDPLSMVRAMCAAARQPSRGRFRDPRVLERAVGKRQYREMVQRGDVVPADPGPGIYLDGWDEWQEGDHTVAERMKRMRERRKRRGNAKVTPPASHDRNDVTTDAGTTKEDGTSPGVGVGGFSPPPQVGRRKNGTNPRARGTNPRANGTSPRQKVAAEKRGGLDSLSAILAQANAAGRPSK
jgi:hypothetical protein